MNQERIAGAAVSTPLTDKLAIDYDYLVDHVTQLQQRGIDLFTLFGTTGEGAS
jgi:dihydrodipicolinate synthase/N-acetylneuraminate lyase